MEYDDDTDDDVSKENYEEDVGVLTKIVDSFNGIDDRIMSIFIANTATGS